MSEVTIRTNDIVHLKLTARWQNDSNQHFAIQHFHRFNVWRDIELLPQALIEDFLPLRIVAIEEHMMVLDCNHPLAKKTIDLKVEIIEIKSASDEHGGRCTEAIDDLFNGPGMQYMNLSV